MISFAALTKNNGFKANKGVCDTSRGRETGEKKKNGILGKRPFFLKCIFCTEIKVLSEKRITPALQIAITSVTPAHRRVCARVCVCEFTFFYSFFFAHQHVFSLTPMHATC